MRIYNYEMMMLAMDKGQIEEAKTWALKHLSEYILQVVGQSNEVGTDIPEIPHRFAYIPEILVKSEKKDRPIVFLNGQTYLNLIGINNKYAYFIRMNKKIEDAAGVEDTQLPNNEVVSVWGRMMNAITANNKVTSQCPVNPDYKKKQHKNEISNEVATSYWFRPNFPDIVERLKSKVNLLAVKAYHGYTYVKNQNSVAYVVKTTESIPLDLDKSSIGKRSGHECIAIKLTDLSLGALYTVSELIAKKKLTEPESYAGSGWNKEML